MRKAFLIVFIAIVALIVGCKTGDQGSISDTNPPARDMSATGGTDKAREMPGGVGITAGQSGTGTTSGASTGY
jgi:hypothetical protein